MRYRCEGGVQLRCLDREPEHLYGWNFGRDRNLPFVVAEWAFQAQTPGILRQHFSPDHQRHGSAATRQAPGDEASYAACTENGMMQGSSGRNVHRLWLLSLLPSEAAEKTIKTGVA